MAGTPLIDQLAALVDLSDVRDRADAVREACTQLRFHEALRRRIPEAAAESRVRGAQASARLDGVEYPLDGVRGLMVGQYAWSEPPDRRPGDTATIQGAVQATAETERVGPIVRTAPLQALARLHVAAASSVVGAAALGRPRVGDEDCTELVDLGPAPSADEVAARLAQVAELVVTGARAANRVPAAVLAAVVHAEILAVRPFVHGNGLVARAMERVLLQSLGLDPTGVAVPEAGHFSAGVPKYVGSAAGYAQGSVDGVALWLRHAMDAYLAGAAEGHRVSDAVRAGRLG